MVQNNITTTQDENEGKFEVSFRVLGNEILAVSILATPLSDSLKSRWVVWAFVISVVTMLGLSMYSDIISEFYQSLTK